MSVPIRRHSTRSHPALSGASAAMFSNCSSEIIPSRVDWTRTQSVDADGQVGQWVVTAAATTRSLRAIACEISVKRLPRGFQRGYCLAENSEVVGITLLPH